MSERLQPRLLVVGHVNLDVEARDLQYFEHMGKTFSKGRISTRIGGSVAHLARVSKGLCSYRAALCCVGADEVGTLLRDFATMNYDEAIVLHKEAPSASVVPLLFRGDGSREVVSPLVSANDLLAVTDVDRPEVIGQVESADVVIVDGYCAIEEDGRRACAQLMQRAVGAGAVALYDLVPHHSFALYGLEALQRLAPAGSVLVAEVRSLACFLGLPVESPVGAVVPKFLEVFPGVVGILRYGEANVRSNRIVAAGIDVLQTTPDPKEELKAAGYGDRLTFGQALSLWKAPHQLGLPAIGLPWTTPAATRSLDDD